MSFDRVNGVGGEADERYAHGGTIVNPSFVAPRFKNAPRFDNGIKPRRLCLASDRTINGCIQQSELPGETEETVGSQSRRCHGTAPGIATSSKGNAIPAGRLYPFTAPIVSPLTTYFWKIMVRTMAGAMIATAAAMTPPQSTSA